VPKIYFPTRFIDVPASVPHGADQAYRVSYGLEHWEDFAEPQYVYKVQMVQKGVVAGRKAPSYPAGSNDLERVCEAFMKIIADLNVAKEDAADMDADKSPPLKPMAA
jgi:hypothetical protein